MSFSIMIKSVLATVYNKMLSTFVQIQTAGLKGYVSISGWRRQIKKNGMCDWWSERFGPTDLQRQISMLVFYRKFVVSFLYWIAKETGGVEIIFNGEDGIGEPNHW